MSVSDVLQRTGPRRLLALDGGGIRGAITIEVLAAIEALLQKKLGRNDNFVLADYFDYVAGTSTGAILAACVAMGMRVERIRAFYAESGRQMFEPSSLLRRLHYRYDREPLALGLQGALGADVTLGDDRIRTLLMMVLRNATTDSPWPISNNPDAYYNERGRADCNLDFPLWKLVRASTAAPVFFPPEVIPVGEDRSFVFVDGGVTMYNNPAFQLFLMATIPPYRLCWPTGAERMLLVSIGTGAAASANAGLQAEQMNLLYNAASIPAALMFAALNEQDVLCRVFGDCRVGGPIDSELGDLIGVPGPGPSKLFTYLRYNAELSKNGLNALGLSHVEPRNVQRMDSVEHIDQLQEVGRAVAARQLDEAHFAGFL